MMMSWNALIVILLAWMVSGNRPSWHNNMNGGVIFSPRYPRYYPNNVTVKYIINAPPGHIAVLTFQDFWTEVYEDSRDYLKVFDGRKREDNVGTDYSGYLRTPFRFISSTRRVRMWFVSDLYDSAQGFRIRYDFINTRTHCAISTLQTTNFEISSCGNERFAFATHCTIRCEDGGVPQDGSISYCVNGNFLPVNCEKEVSRCNVDVLTSSRSEVVSCSNQISGQAHSCVVKCARNYESNGTNVVTCVGDEFPPVNCKKEVSRCNVDVLTSNRSEVVSCSNQISGQAHSCVVKCARNYESNGTNAVTCVGGEFPPVNCQLISSLVTHCEETELVDCPYTLDEIIDYYDFARLDPDINLTNRMLEEAELEEVPEPPSVNIGRTPRRCWAPFCLHRYIGPKKFYPFKCGRCRGRRQRKTCLFCRYKSKCRKPSPLYL